MGDVGIESTLVLDGLAVSKVRFYSTLDSDVGKRVEITDKFNPQNVFTGTFDESLNLLYDLPAFTSYRVKMYGSDGETVESDQSFMLKGYDYLEKNVGLNKNSFAGIKAIVDQGLENSMLEVGHTWVEDDGDYPGEAPTWVITAINAQPADEPKQYRHSVFVARKQTLQFTSGRDAVKNYITGEYYNSLPSNIKDTLTSRRRQYITYNGVLSWPVNWDWYTYLPEFGELEGRSQSVEYDPFLGSYRVLPYYANKSNRIAKDITGVNRNYWLYFSAINYASKPLPVYINSNGDPSDAASNAQATLPTIQGVPHMMIASGLIE